MLVAKADTLRDTPTPRPQDPEPDLRVLPVRYQRDGHRRRDFSESVDMLTTTAHSEWKVAGPRSYGWGDAGACRAGVQTDCEALVGVDEHQFLVE